MAQSVASSHATLRTTLVYDFMLVPGGAERVCLHLLETHPDWRLLTGFVDHQAFSDIRVPWSRVDALGRSVRHPARQALQVLRAFERRGTGLKETDRVLFSGVYAPVGVRHRPAGQDAYYCHTPPRFAYDLEDWYLERARAWERPALRRLAAHVRDRYAEALEAMGAVAANSHTVRRRLEHYLGVKDVTVIHPPVATAQWQWLGQEGYYLSNARVEPYKRVEWAVRSFMQLPEHQLVVTSGGSDLERLRALASGHANIRFTGWCDDATLKALTGNCIATLYLAREEDFGMAPIESMAAGKPVIGVAEGGLCETVSPPDTGRLLEPGLAGDTEALAAAILDLDPATALAMRPACEARAARFDACHFDAGIDRLMVTHCRQTP
ncbi:MAG: glycosyltransferase [Pseudomonadota bacterium]